MSSVRACSRQVVALLRERGLTVGTAESLTAGMIAAEIAGVPGASQVLMGGIVSYDARVKHELLAVPTEVIDGVGVVSEACALQMAKGARERLGVDITVSVTGLAGPGGGTAETPVGTVFLGIADQSGARVEKRRFRGGRQAVRRKTTRAALEMILDTLQAK